MLRRGTVNDETYDDVDDGEPDADALEHSTPEAEDESDENEAVIPPDDDNDNGESNAA
jgi:hypothetical protein